MHLLSPKTLAIDGLLSTVYEPQKFTDFGLNARKAMKAITGVTAFRDLVIDLTTQLHKKHFHDNNELSLPGREKLPVHVDEVLR